MNQIDSAVIVGGGLAGANAAFALRDRGFTGRVTLLTDERELPYERPPVSKEYLRGEKPLDEMRVKPAEDYTAHDIDVRAQSAVVRIDRAHRFVRLADGARIGYDALILATGAAPRELDLPGARLGGVHYLRNAHDADALRAAAAEARSVAVIGGGWIGSEVAASLRQLGHAVTLISNTERPLERVLGPEVGEVYRQLHVDNGVVFVHGDVAAIEGTERVSGVRLTDGRLIASDLVVVGVGARPRVALAEAAGLELADGGVAVDERLRTSDPAIYAAGDIAAAWNPRFGHRLRLEHWDNAIRQGKTAAANAIGADETYDRVPYFYSDQFDLGMEYRGFALGWDSVVFRGDRARREFDAFWLRGGHVVAAMNANRWDDADLLQRLVESGARVDPVRLTREEDDLAEAA